METPRSDRTFNIQECDDVLERETLCLPDFEADLTTEAGSEGFVDSIQRYFNTSDSNATEQLVRLKYELRKASTYDFWDILLRRLCDTLGGQSSFVTKRMVKDPEDPNIQLPLLGQPGACFMAVAFYVRSETSDPGQLFRDYKYAAEGTPCYHMKQDKVFLIPEKMSDFIRDNPNTFPWQPEAFLAVPLFKDGSCFAHFGLMWSTEGAKQRKLGWAYIETFMHGLEDLILARALEEGDFGKSSDKAVSTPAPKFPTWAMSQYLKPFGRSLFHELRTPMQGVIGALDIMHYTVIDALESPKEARDDKSIFLDLKRNIEQVQESSSRAVDAVDNVVHAYDHNMEMPATPLSSEDEDPIQRLSDRAHNKTSTSVLEASSDVSSPSKRLRSDSVDFHPGPPMKRFARIPRQIATEDSCRFSPDLEKVNKSSMCLPVAGVSTRIADMACQMSGGIFDSPRRPLNTNTQKLLRDIISSCLDAAHLCPSDVVEEARSGFWDVHYSDAYGHSFRLVIRYQLSLQVPLTVLTEQKHLRFCLQKLVDNAVKFTKDGEISVSVDVTRQSQVLEFRVADSGCGISELFKEHIFKPHFQEDSSTARRRDGLGLSLFNAKAHVRKDLGGDLILERSTTHDSKHGSTFLIRIPLLVSVVPSNAPPQAPAPESESCEDIDSTAVISKIEASRQSCSIRRPEPSTAQSPTMSSTSIASLRLARSPSMNKVSYNRQLAAKIPLNFLVAEDNKINSSLLVTFLTRLGYPLSRISIAEDGIEAVSMYKASLALPPERHINAILMDLWMPNMDGYEATEQILALARKAQSCSVSADIDSAATSAASANPFVVMPAVVAVTADITSESVEKTRTTGMIGYLSKPFKVLDIQRLLIRHFGAAGDA